MNALLPELQTDNESSYHQAERTFNSPATLAHATVSGTVVGLPTTVKTYNRMDEQDSRRPGRPHAILEDGAKQKIKLWLALKGKHRSYLTNGKAGWTAGPTQRTLARWLELGVPRDKLPDLANRMGIAERYLRSNVSPHEFEKYIENTESKHIVRGAQDNAGFISTLQRVLSSNDHFVSALRAIVNSDPAPTIDDIADILNVSFIQVRAILEDLMKIDIIIPRVDSGQTVIVLSKIATELVSEIGKLLDGA